jgi:hypothetical protein
MLSEKELARDRSGTITIALCGTFIMHDTCTQMPQFMTRRSKFLPGYKPLLWISLSLTYVQQVNSSTSLHEGLTIMSAGSN